MSHDLTAFSANQEPLEFLNTIGQGSFTMLRLCWHILTKTEVAVKVSRAPPAPRDFHCRKSTIRSPWITYIWSSYLRWLTPRKHFSPRSPVVEEMCSITYRTIATWLSLRPKAFSGWAVLVYAVQYCQQRDIIHRDLNHEMYSLKF